MKSLITLVGMKHHPPALQALAACSDGKELLLVREPTNKYDPNAIQVVMLLGYVKKEQAAKLAPTMDDWVNTTGDLGVRPAKLVRNEGTYVELEIEEPEVRTIP